MEEIQILNVRSICDQSLDTIDITEYVDDESASSTLKKYTGKPSESGFAKPALTYSILISLAFKNSNYSRLTVIEIYAFISKHFPYFQASDRSWKSAVRHNLCMNPYFMRFDPFNFDEPDAPVRKNMGGKKGLTWAVNPAKIAKIETGIQRAIQIATKGARVSMRHPEDIVKIMAGRIEQMEPSETAVFEEDSDQDDDKEDEVEQEDEEEPVTEALFLPEKQVVFTQFEDGAFPLITLYSKTPGDHKSFSASYPVV